MPDALASHDATALAELVRRGDASPRELVDAAIARIERLNPELNAVITPLFEKARAQASSARLPDGPFRGVPFLLKDLVAQSAGDPYCAGMRLLRERRWASPDDSFLVAKLRAAGFIFLGKTNVPELGPLPTTEPDAFGPSRNPWDPTRSTGGSSGGSAAAVASGMVPVAHANDGGGSIRIPASECGLVGLKPSRGRVSLGPEIGESWAGMAIELVVSRTVRDTAGVLDAVAGHMPGDPYTAPPPARPFRAEVGAEPGRLRIGVMPARPGGGAVDPECSTAVRGAARQLEALGHTVEEAHPTTLDELETMRHAVTIVTTSMARDLAVWGERLGAPIRDTDVEPMTWALAEMGRAVPGVDYLRAVERLSEWSRRVASWWEGGFDLLLTPTLPEPPPTLGQFKPTPDDPLHGFGRGGDFVTFTLPFNVTGQPAISLPLHWSAGGLPIGVQLAAAYAREDVLLRVAAQLERAHPWRDRRPRIHAS